MNRIHRTSETLCSFQYFESNQPTKQPLRLNVHIRQHQPNQLGRNLEAPDRIQMHTRLEANGAMKLVQQRHIHLQARPIVRITKLTQCGQACTRHRFGGTGTARHLVTDATEMQRPLFGMVGQTTSTAKEACARVAFFHHVCDTPSHQERLLANVACARAVWAMVGLHRRGRGLEFAAYLALVLALEDAAKTGLTNNTSVVHLTLPMQPVPTVVEATQTVIMRPFFVELNFHGSVGLDAQCGKLGVRAPLSGKLVALEAVEMRGLHLEAD